MTRSPRHLREQVRETVSDLPVHAARLAVLGVGKALLFTDRVRKDYREARESGLGPVIGRLRHDAEKITGKVVHRASERLPGRAETKASADDDTEIAVGKPPKTAAAATAQTDAEAEAAVAATVTEPRRPAAPKETGTMADKAKPEPATDLPVPDYDTATLASVRARLRSLDVKQVARLRDYERTHAARADFLRMYENRIAKLREQGG